MVNYLGRWRMTKVNKVAYRLRKTIRVKRSIEFRKRIISKRKRMGREGVNEVADDN